MTPYAICEETLSNCLWSEFAKICQSLTANVLYRMHGILHFTWEFNSPIGSHQVVYIEWLVY